MHEALANMTRRAEQCRRLADITHDEKMHWQLTEWANEIDADIERLEAELSGKSSERDGITSREPVAGEPIVRGS
jgi:hypothetical protein